MQEWYTRRREQKFYVNQIQYTLLSSLLGAVLSRDPHCGEDGHYFVRSLYFDSSDHRDWSEKEMGSLHRQKIRLRYYDVQGAMLKLETKEKHNKHTIKQSYKISRQDMNSMIDGDYNFLLSGESSTGANSGQAIPDERMRLYNHLQSHHYTPSVIIDYEREAYIHSSYNIRINFDQCIRCSRFTEKAFEDIPGMIPAISPTRYILEVKHDGHLPSLIQQILSQVDLTPVSYSKYYYALIV